MSTYFWEFRSEQIGTLAMLAVIPVFAGVLTARPLSARFDKRRAAIGLALFAVLWGPLPVLLRLADLMPANGSTALFAAIAFHAGLLVFAAIQLGILYSSMIMDVVDESELATGKRQEGIFVSAIAFTNKAVSGVGNMLGGIALQAIGFPEGAESSAVGSVPPETVGRLGLAQGPGMMVLYLASLAFVSRYAISRDQYAEIRRELDSRRSG